MKIMGFSMFRRNSAQDAESFHAQQRHSAYHNAYPGLKVVWQFRPNTPIDKCHSKNPTLPADVILAQDARLDDCLQKRQIGLHREETLSHALKQFGIRFVR